MTKVQIKIKSLFLVLIFLMIPTLQALGFTATHTEKSGYLCIQNPSYVVLTEISIAEWKKKALERIWRRKYGLENREKISDTEWKKKALEWKEKYRTERKKKNAWIKKAGEWKVKYLDCRKDANNEPDPEPNKKLTVENGKILYGGNPIKLCGVSRWEALWRETGEHDSAGGWGKYSLDWYENKLIESGINYVRHAGIKDTDYLYAHCEKMKEAGIIVEITVFRAHKGSKGILVNLADMGELAKLGNVFFDINNEFLDGPDVNIDEAIRIARILKKQGCIISGGAWSGAEGKRQAQRFLRAYPDVDIITHHRSWNSASFKETLAHGKPVAFNEFFSMRSGMSLIKTKQLMRLAFDCGVQAVAYYGFRDKEMFPGLKKSDPFNYQSILDYAGSLVK